MIEQLFGSKTRVKLLHLFLGNPDRAFFVREITRKIDEQINSVRRELSNLLSIGIITSESNNNKLYYKVNQSSPHFEALQSMFSDGSTKEVAQVAGGGRLSDRFLALGNVSLAILTGNFVQRADMNIDIFIVGNVQRRKLASFIKELEEEERRPLNYTIMTDSDFHYRLDVNDRFVNKVLRQPKIVIIDSGHVMGGNDLGHKSKKVKEGKVK